MGKHTKDIKQQIEDAKKELSIELSGNKIQGDQSYNIGLLTGAEIASRIFLSKWQESERWRDVYKELPEYSGKEFEVLVKKGKSLNVFPIYSKESIIYLKDLHEFWKPIRK